MKFRTWWESTVDFTALAQQIANDYNADRSLDIGTIFDRHTNGLSEPEKDQVYALVVQLAKSKILKLRPAKNGRYRGELQNYISDAPPPKPPKQMPMAQQMVLDEMFKMVAKSYAKWIAAEYEESAEPLDHDRLNEFLEERFGVKVRPDGLINFTYLTPSVHKLIGDNEVVVYHHTTDAIDQEVSRRGLLGSNTQGIKKVNPHLNSGAGVYVTTRLTGSEINHYHNFAIQHHGGGGMTYGIRTTLDELRPDPDDEDLSVGRYQFVLPYVMPGQIVERL